LKDAEMTDPEVAQLQSLLKEQNDAIQALCHSVVKLQVALAHVGNQRLSEAMKATADASEHVDRASDIATRVSLALASDDPPQ